MLYGSEYIISLSHREKIYCNHPAFLLIISINGSRGSGNALDSSHMWSYLRLLLFIASLPYSVSPSLLFSAHTNAENYGPNWSAWDSFLKLAATAILKTLHPDTFSCKRTWISPVNSAEDSCMFLPLVFLHEWREILHRTRHDVNHFFKTQFRWFNRKPFITTQKGDHFLGWIDTILIKYWTHWKLGICSAAYCFRGHCKLLSCKDHFAPMSKTHPMPQ